MIRPRPAQPSYLLQASNTRRWAQAVADQQGVSPRAVARAYRTPRALAVPVAAILRAYCHREATRLVREGEPAPTGADILDQTIARLHAAYLPIKQAHDRAEADATVAYIRALQARDG